MFKIENNRLIADNTDISDTFTIDQLKQEGETLLAFAKFRVTVEKAAEACFGAPKKRKPRAVKKPEIAEVSAPTIAEVAAPAVAEIDETLGYSVLEDGSLMNNATGEVL